MIINAPEPPPFLPNAAEDCQHFCAAFWLSARSSLRRAPARLCRGRVPAWRAVAPYQILSVRRDRARRRGGSSPRRYMRPGRRRWPGCSRRSSRRRRCRSWWWSRSCSWGGSGSESRRGSRCSCCGRSCRSSWCKRCGRCCSRRRSRCRASCRKPKGIDFIVGTEVDPATSHHAGVPLAGTAHQFVGAAAGINHRAGISVVAVQALVPSDAGYPHNNVIGSVSSCDPG